MTDEAMKEINEWIDAAQAKQPDRSLMLFCYVRDGNVHLGRGDVPLDMKNFPTEDLPSVRELITTAIDSKFVTALADEDE